MVERGIIFTGPMVRAISDGRKTQTRRVVKSQPDAVHGVDPYWHVGGYRAWRYRDTSDTLRMGTHNELQCPYGKPGNRLWVRETWRPCGDDEMSMGGIEALRPSIAYKADEEWDNESKWRPSIHMPRWASRITLEITDISVERLQDISHSDAEAEGARWRDFGKDQSGQCLPGWSMEDPFPEYHAGCLSTARMAFANYINKLHGGKNWNLKPSCLWDENPWVWVIEFKR